jgi:hypothetical protein
MEMNDMLPGTILHQSGPLRAANGSGNAQNAQLALQHHMISGMLGTLSLHAGQRLG